MTARALQQAPARVMTLAEQLASPCVLVDFAPGCPTERLEVLAPPHGPRPADVVRAVARCLTTRAAVLDAEPDEETADPSVFYVLLNERRAARVYGLTLDAFIDGLLSAAVIDEGVGPLAGRRLRARRRAAIDAPDLPEEAEHEGGAA